MRSNNRQLRDDICEEEKTVWRMYWMIVWNWLGNCGSSLGWSILLGLPIVFFPDPKGPFLGFLMRKTFLNRFESPKYPPKKMQSDFRWINFAFIL